MFKDIETILFETVLAVDETDNVCTPNPPLELVNLKLEDDFGVLARIKELTVSR